MTDIILYISIIVVSGIVGSKVRAYRDRLGWTGTVQTMAIVLLVVLMGARMGANEEIIDNLGTIGLAAFAMTIAMMIGSLLCLFLCAKGAWLYEGRKNRRSALRRAYGSRYGGGSGSRSRKAWHQ